MAVQDQNFSCVLFFQPDSKLNSLILVTNLAQVWLVSPRFPEDGDLGLSSALVIFPRAPISSLGTHFSFHRAVIDPWAPTIDYQPLTQMLLLTAIAFQGTKGTFQQFYPLWPILNIHTGREQEAKNIQPCGFSRSVHIK